MTQTMDGVSVTSPLNMEANHYQSYVHFLGQDVAPRDQIKETEAPVIESAD